MRVPVYPQLGTVFFDQMRSADSSMRRHDGRVDLPLQCFQDRAQRCHYVPQRYFTQNANFQVATGTLTSAGHGPENECHLDFVAQIK